MATTYFPGTNTPVDGNEYKIPSSGEDGSVVFPILEDNIRRTADHDHSGSSTIKLKSDVALTRDILVVDGTTNIWVAAAGISTTYMNGSFPSTYGFACSMAIPNGKTCDTQLIQVKYNGKVEPIDVYPEATAGAPTSFTRVIVYVATEVAPANNLVEVHFL